MSGYFRNALDGQRVITDDGLWSYVVHYGSGDYLHKVTLTSFASVPEPSTLILAISALTILLAKRRRKT
jgi:hypothetical protein